MQSAEQKWNAEDYANNSSAQLHWARELISRLSLRGYESVLDIGCGDGKISKAGGKIILQMGGRGNAADIFGAMEAVKQSSQWAPYFGGFTPPCYFYGPEEYQEWLSASGFRGMRVELIPKDMQHQGVKGLMGWLRTLGFLIQTVCRSNCATPFLRRLSPLIQWRTQSTLLEIHMSEWFA